MKENHLHCILCGERNPWSLKLRFTAGEDGTVRASFRGRRLLQGYDGLLHGGVIASLLDSAMTNCLFRQKITALTGELRIRYLRPVPCDAMLELRAAVTSSRPPLYMLDSELRLDGVLMARASAKFMNFPAAK
ncbi:MAG: PaaI family thioesterase [Victivallaceae bacterium]